MKIKRFEAATRFHFFNRTAQVLLFAAACFMGFLLAWKRLPSFDLTTNGRYSLTPETISYLHTLPQEVEIIGSMSLGEETSLGRERLHELQGLTQRYASITPKLHVKWIDGFRAQAEFGFKNPYQILLKSGSRSVWITPDELYVPRDDMFLGERALTSGLWKVSNTSAHRVTVLVNKERWDADGAWGFKRLAEFFASQNTAVRLIEASELSSDDSTSDALFVLDGAEKLDTDAFAALQRRINDHRGSVFLAVEEAATESLTRFLYFNGVIWPGERVDETDNHEKTPRGELLIRHFEDHPATQQILKNDQMVLSGGHWWAMQPRKPMVDVSFVPLVLSSSTSIVEGLEKNVDGKNPQRKGPFVMMSLLERKTKAAAANSSSTANSGSVASVSSLDVASRVVLCGGVDWLSNAYLSYRGNQTLLTGVFDWMVGSGELVSIPGRARQSRQLGLNSVQLWKMGVGVFSCALVLMGLGVIRWISRPK